MHSLRGWWQEGSRSKIGRFYAWPVPFMNSACKRSRSPTPTENTLPADRIAALEQSPDQYGTSVLSENPNNPDQSFAAKAVPDRVILWDIVNDVAKLPVLRNGNFRNMPPLSSLRLHVKTAGYIIRLPWELDETRRCPKGNPGCFA